MFENRLDAAKQLVPYLQSYESNPHAIVVAIPRGGLQLGYILARQLHLPLDVIFTKKIGYPGNPEYAIGAVDMHHVFISPDFTNIPDINEYVAEETIKIRKQLQERALLYRGNKPPLNLQDKIIILVDDGVATGSTMLATLSLIKQEKPQKIVIALPVAPPETLALLNAQADEVICLKVPELFFGVGQFYQNFEQVDDQEAIRLLNEANA